MNFASLNLTTTIVGYGRFLFLCLDPDKVDSGILRSMESLGTQLENMHFVDGYPSEETPPIGRIQYVRAAPGTVREGEVVDQGMSSANALIRLEGRDPRPLLAYESCLRVLVEQRGGAVRALTGVQKPRSYTSYAMTQFAYARALAPASGTKHPLAVVTPQDKTREWWDMDWMRRESFFLPRYDESGTVIAKGHALVSAAGIPAIVRRLFHNPEGYNLGSGYDFIGYFEFAEADADVFRAVMSGLRDRAENPEWNFVREGPEWWGKRVARLKDVWV